MMNEKIKEGTIRIENDRVVGLGMTGEESIDLIALNELLDKFSLLHAAEFIDETVMKIGEVSLFLNDDAEEDATKVRDEIKNIIQGTDTLYRLHQISKFFKS